MEKMLLFLVLEIIVLLLMIFYFNIRSRFLSLKDRLDLSKEQIDIAIRKKDENMRDILKIIKKNLKNTEQFDEYEKCEIEKFNTYEADEILEKNYDEMLSLRDGHKTLNTKEADDLYKRVNMFNQIIIANKKFFNEANTKLLKEFKGPKKLIAKLNRIQIRNSFEIKEPVEES